MRHKARNINVNLYVCVSTKPIKSYQFFKWHFCSLNNTYNVTLKTLLSVYTFTHKIYVVFPIYTERLISSPTLNNVMLKKHHLLYKEIWKQYRNQMRYLKKTKYRI